VSHAPDHSAAEPRPVSDLRYGAGAGIQRRHGRP
jgi:hypothetical protein